MDMRTDNLLNSAVPDVSRGRCRGRRCGVRFRRPYRPRGCSWGAGRGSGGRVMAELVIGTVRIPSPHSGGSSGPVCLPAIGQPPGRLHHPAARRLGAAATMRQAIIIAAEADERQASGQSSKTCQQMALRRCWSSRTSSRIAAGRCARCHSRSLARARAASPAGTQALAALMAYAAAPRSWAAT